jgi:hypothetical protein
MKKALFLIFLFEFLIFNFGFAESLHASQAGTSEYPFYDTTFFDYPQSCVAVAIDNNGYIYANHSKYIIKSADTAATWDTIYDGSSNPSFPFSIFVASNGYVYAGYSRNKNVLCSTDRGSSWDTCLVFKDDTSCMWYMAEDALGNLFIAEYSGGDGSERRATLWRSRDNGASWDTVYRNTRERHMHLVGVDPYTNYVYASTGESGYFVRSRDGGDTWNVLQTGSGAKYTAIEFSPGRRILGEDQIYSSIVITSNDRDFTTVYTPFISGQLYIMRRIGDDYYAALTPSKGRESSLHILVSSDGGLHWTIAKDYHSGFPSQILHIARNTVGGWAYFAYRTADIVWKLARFTDAIFVPEESNQVSMYRFLLNQNYPNPFNSSTTIPFTVHGEQKTENVFLLTTLKIYNIRGELVRTLMEDRLRPGMYEVSWDGKNKQEKWVASGVYFYRLEAGELIQTKKMVLIR